MNADDLPLLTLFKRLCQAGLPLGLTEYQLLLSALQSGHGLPDKAALARLCGTLWVKSAEDQALFDYHFEAVMAEDVAQFLPEVSDTITEQPTEPTVPSRFPMTWWKSLSRPKQLAFSGVLGGALLTVVGVSLWQNRPVCPYFTSTPERIVSAAGDYRYEAQACKASPSDRLKITALQMHPGLTVESQEDGTALLEGNISAENVVYSAIRFWTPQGEALTGFGDSESIQFVDVGPNGQHLITRSGSGSAHLWDRAGNRIADLSTLLVEKVTFSPDGSLIIITSVDGSAFLLNTEGEIVSAFEGRDDVRDVQFNPEGDRLAVVFGDGSAGIWSGTGEKLIELNNQGIVNVRFSPDQQRFLTQRLDDVVQIREADGEILTTLSVAAGNKKDSTRVSEQADRRDIRDAYFSFDGQHVLLIPSADSAFLWNLQGEWVQTFRYAAPFVFAQFSSDGQHLVTRSSDDTAQLWDISLSKPLLKLPETYQYDDQQAKDSTALDQDSVQDAWQDKETLIRSIQFSPNGAYLLVNSAADTARLLTLDGEIVSDFSNLTSISGIEFTHNGQYILTRLLNSAPAPGISGYPVRLWDSEGAQFTKFNDLPVNGISVSADEQAIVTVSEGREIILQVEKEEKQLEGPQSKDQPLSNAQDSVPATQSFTLFRADEMEGLSERLFQLLLQLGLVSALWAFGLLPIGYVLARYFTERRQQPETFPERDLDAAEGGTGVTAISALNQILDDEVQVVRAVHQGDRTTVDIPLSAFADSSDYFPITGRQMKQSWRSLRRMVRTGAATELDVAATIRQVSREGILLQPVRRPRRVNRNELLLMVDQEGSMVPFHGLSQRLAQTAIHGGRLAKTGIYYFHNCPNQYLYDDLYRQEAVPINNVLTSVDSAYTGVLIFSDAGAARGSLNLERLELTLAFLDQLSVEVQHVAWLNPVPCDRWSGTTAGEIAKRVPMFELTRQGLDLAIAVLRGKPVYQSA